MSVTSQLASTPARVRSGTKKPWYLRFGYQVIAGLVIGVILGFLAKWIGPDLSSGKPAANWLTGTLTTIGNAYVSLLRAAVIPLILTAVISSMTNLRHVTNAMRLAGKTVLWFAITAAIAVTIGIILGLLFQPGSVADHSLKAHSPGGTVTWWDFLLGLVPGNFLGASVSTSISGTGDAMQASSSFGFNALQVIVIAFVIGIAALRVGAKAEPVIEFTASALKIVQKILWWIIRLTPIGTIGLLGKAVAVYGWDTLGSLGLFVVTIYVGLVLVIFGVYPILLRTHGLSVKQYFSGAWPAIQLGFVSRSSFGTLPVTERVTEQNLGVPRSYASFAVPLGSTTKMDGCAAIYPAAAAIFVAQFFNVQLQWWHYLLIAFVSIVGSAATAGTTGATVMLTLTLTTVGLPLEGVGLLLAIDPILDMGRTAVNVAGQALVPVIVAKREKILDLVRYNAPRRGEGFTLDDVQSDAAGAATDVTDGDTATFPRETRDEVVSVGATAGKP